MAPTRGRNKARCVPPDCSNHTTHVSSPALRLSGPSAQHRCLISLFSLACFCLWLWGPSLFLIVPLVVTKGEGPW